MNLEPKPERERIVMLRFLHLIYLNLTNRVPFHEGTGDPALTSVSLFAVS